MTSLLTLQVWQVPAEFREPGIINGYRSPNMTFKDACRSLFSLHNETSNIWTHLLACFFFIYYLSNSQLDYGQVEYHPYLCLLITCILFTLASALAHLFNSMSTYAHHICYMLDYMAISIYTFGAAIANRAYAFPPSWKDGYLGELFVPGMFVVCVVFNYTLCLSRFQPKSKVVKLRRVASAISSYVCAMYPCIKRTLFYKRDDFNDATTLYGYNMVLYAISAIIFGSHMPDVLSPGGFDVYCQSHTIFHITTAIGSFMHLRGIEEDLQAEVNRTENLGEHGPTLSPLAYLAALAITNSAVLIYLAVQLKKQYSSQLANGNHLSGQLANGNHSSGQLTNGNHSAGQSANGNRHFALKEQ